MKRMVKIIGIGLVGLLLLMGGILFYLSRQTDVPVDYQARVETGGSIEARYLQQGNYNVSTEETKTLLSFGAFKVFYPQEMLSTSQIYPVIVLANGTGVP